jgi:F0F1-type ATP synthase membrane subunit b/b'
MAETAQQRTAESGGDAREKAQQVADQAQQTAQQAAGQAKGRLREEVDRRSTQAGEQVGSTAGDIRTVAEQLRKQGQDAPAKVAEQVADRAERVGSYLRDQDADSILSDAEELGRRNPWAVAGGALFLGFAASRLLKASSVQRYSGRPQAGRSGARTLNGGSGGAPLPAVGGAGLGDASTPGDNR